MKKKGMAAQFTDVTLEDMDKFLKRGFRALRPAKGVKGEVYYDLKLGDNVGVRVWTSVKPHSGMGAGVGDDAIRVQLVSLKDQGPLEKGKAPIVKRTQGWRNSLQSKIEEFIEKYDDNEDFWENWAGTRSRGGAPKPEIVKEEPVRPAPPRKGGFYLEQDGSRWYILGNTYPIKDSIKSSGGRFDGARKAWYFQNENTAKDFLSRFQRYAAETSEPIE